MTGGHVKNIILSMAFASLTVLASAQQTGPVTLKYKFSGTGDIRYIINAKMTQAMDIEGQIMDVNVTSAFGCKVASSGGSGENLNLKITIDTLGQSTISPMGESGGAVTELKGREFSVVIAPDGKSIDLSDAEKIAFNMEGSGESNLAQTFVDFFPRLPGNPVRVGDTWNSTDTLRTNSAAMNMKTSVDAVNKLEAIENYGGIECARISADMSGIQDLNVRNQGMDIKMKGPYTGKSEVLFAIRDGYFLKQTATMKMKGTVDISQPEQMSFPVTIDRSSVSEIVK